MIADSFDLALLFPTNPGPTRFSDTTGESNSVINLMFLRYGSAELDKHSILPDSRLSSNHAPLLIDIPIFDEVIYMSKLTITSKSEQETEFIKDVISKVKLLDMTNIDDIDKLDRIVNQLGSIVELLWAKNAKKSPNILSNGGQRCVVWLSISTELQEVAKTGSSSNRQSKTLSNLSLTTKFKKLQIRVEVLGN